MTPKIIDKKERKDHIVQVAIGIFTQKGLERTTIREIAEAAGMGKGTIYEYFKSKEELVQYSFQFFMHRMGMDLEEILISPLNAREKLERIIDSFIQIISPEFRQMMGVTLHFWGEAMRTLDTHNIIFNEMRDFYKSYTSIFADIMIEGIEEGLFREDLKPLPTAALLVGMMDGVMLQWLLDMEYFDPDVVLRSIIPLMFEGILKEEK